MQDKAVKEIASHWVGFACKLDGKHAVVSGRLLPHGLIRQLESPGTAVEFSWQTIDRIMQTSKHFSS